MTLLHLLVVRTLLPPVATIGERYGGKGCHAHTHKVVCGFSGPASQGGMVPQYIVGERERERERENVAPPSGNYPSF